MIVHTAHLICRPDCINAFRERLLQHAQITRERESGCDRFDVHQCKDKPNLFLLYEVYSDGPALEAHQRSEHFQAFRADTANWVTDRTWWFWSLQSDEKQQ